MRRNHILSKIRTLMWIIQFGLYCTEAMKYVMRTFLLRDRIKIVTITECKEAFYHDKSSEHESQATRQ